MTKNNKKLSKIALKTGKIVTKTVITGIKVAAGVAMLGSAVLFFVTKGLLISIVELEERDKNSQK